MVPNNQPDLGQDLLRIHHAITRGLSISLEKGITFLQNGFPDTATRKGYTDYVQSLAIVLSAHHLSEDEIAFPAVIDRIPTAPYDRLAADHRKIAALLDPIRGAVPQVAGGETAGLARLVDDLHKAIEVWSPHIQVEETNFSSRALSTVLTPEEQGRLSGLMAKHAQEHATPGYLALPFTLYNLNPDERAAMAATMPAVVVDELIPKAWKAQWASMQPFFLS